MTLKLADNPCETKVVTNKGGEAVIMDCFNGLLFVRYRSKHDPFWYTTKCLIDGRLRVGETEPFIINAPEPEQTIERWVNIYSYGRCSLHVSKEAANESLHNPDRIALKKITITFRPGDEE